jgi:hypothetical protein
LKDFLCFFADEIRRFQSLRGARHTHAPSRFTYRGKSRAARKPQQRRKQKDLNFFRDFSADFPKAGIVFRGRE